VAEIASAVSVVLKRSSSSLAQHMPIKLISPIFIDSADDYIHGDQRDTIGPHLDVDEMNPHEDAKFIQANHQHFIINFEIKYKNT
jgi:hypothetical protein